MDTVQKWATFFRLYLNEPRAIGAMPSSIFLAARMVEWLDLERAKVVLVSEVFWAGIRPVISLDQNTRYKNA